MTERDAAVSDLTPDDNPQREGEGVRPTPTWEAPEGFVHVAAPDDQWVIGKMASGRCRWLSGFGGKACAAPAVASLHRSRTAQTQWWDYCGDHLYGRWIENGQVMSWVARPIEEAEPDAAGSGL